MGDDHADRQLALPTIEDALSHVAEAGLRGGPVGTAGLELEGHLVDRRALERRPCWSEVAALVREAPALPSGSSLTVEPGGQLELSTVPAPDLAAAVAALYADESVLTGYVRSRGFGIAFLGLDPLRPGLLVNPAPRYAVMSDYFDRAGCGAAGRLVMTGSAGLQLNLEAGPAELWSDRLAALDRLAPVLAAMSACSSMAAGSPHEGRAAASLRQLAWQAIDESRTAPVAFGSEPAAGWAAYALDARVMMIRSAEPSGPDDHGPVTKHHHAGLSRAPSGLTFREWITAPATVGRPPTTTDLDYHLTTLFPTVRPRGYLELRFLDAVPMSWWPGLAAVVGTLIDDPAAADAVAELLAGVDLDWQRAAELGLADPVLGRLAGRAAALAVDHCPAELRAEAAAYADLVAAGRTPGDVLRDAVAGDPRRLLEKALDA